MNALLAAAPASAGAYFGNGLSGSEIEKLSTTVKSFVYVGAMKQAGMIGARLVGAPPARRVARV